MMDFGAAQAAVGSLRIQAITLAEPVFEAAGGRREDVSRGTVRRAEAHVFGAAPDGVVLDAVAARGDAHARAVIRQVDEGARAPDGEGVVGVEAEKPDAGFALVLDVQT